MEVKFFFLTSVVLIFVNSAFTFELPEDIEKCSISDPNLNKCAAKAANQVIKVHNEGKLEIFNLDPMRILYLVSDTGHGIKMTMSNVNITGFKDMYFDEINIDMDKKVWFFKIKISYMNILYNTHLVGKMLIFTLNSKGLANATADDVVLNLKIKYDLKNSSKDNKTHIVVNDTHVYFIVNGKLKVYTENLFPGNRLINDKMNEMINEHWRVLFDQMREPLEGGVGIAFKQILNIFFKQTAYDNLFLP